MATHDIKRNDTRPYWPVTLTYEDGTAVNLSGATCVFHARNRSTNVVKFSVAVTVTDSTAGEIEWRPLASETDEIGQFDCEWEVTFADGTIQTFPTRPPNDRLRVHGDLA
jgi:hypothetical protein